MGPPTKRPSFVFSLNLTASTTSANLVVIPNIAAIHIQKIAPGPPRAIAVATPAILPVPTVAARAVATAWKAVTSPSPTCSLENILIKVFLRT